MVDLLGHASLSEPHINSTSMHKFYIIVISILAQAHPSYIYDSIYIATSLSVCIIQYTRDILELQGGILYC